MAAAAAAVVGVHHNEFTPKGKGRRNSRSNIGNNLTSVLGVGQDSDELALLLPLAKLDQVLLKQIEHYGHDDWQPRHRDRRTRVIVTEERLHLLLSRTHNGKYEVADYIPLEDVRGISKTDVGEKSLNSIKSVKHPKAVAPATASFVLAEVPTDVASISADAADDPLLRHAGVISPSSSSPDDSGRHDSAEPQCLFAFEIRTAPDGYNQGKKFRFGAFSEETCEQCVATITELSIAAAKAFERRHRIELMQHTIKKFYDTFAFQGSMGCAILINFMLTILQMQLTGNEYDHIFDSIDISFTALFAAELLVNFLAHAVWPFVRDGWNLFDLAVVSASVVLLIATAGGNNALVKQLRVLRVFRVLRAFRRLGEFRQIINSIIASVLPGLQALIIGLIVVAIYGTIGVQYFGDTDHDSFGDFFHAFYTLFGVVAFQRWPDGKVQAFDDNGNVVVPVVAYVYSYIVVVVFVMLNVVVAVILDNFQKSAERDRAATAREFAVGENLFAAGGPLEPVLQTLLTSFDTRDDLGHRVAKLFDKFDTDASGKISCDEISEGLYKLDPKRKARFKLEDFHQLTRFGELCDEEGDMDIGQFKVAVIQELRRLIQRNTAHALFCMEPTLEVGSLLASAKQSMVEAAAAATAAAAAAAVRCVVGVGYPCGPAAAARRRTAAHGGAGGSGRRGTLCLSRGLTAPPRRGRSRPPWGRPRRRGGGRASESEWSRLCVVVIQAGTE